MLSVTDQVKPATSIMALRSNMSFNSQLKKMPALSFQMLRSLQITQIVSGTTAIPLEAQMDLQLVLDLKILAISGILRLHLMLALTRVSFLILTQ